MNHSSAMDWKSPGSTVFAVAVLIVSLTVSATGCGGGDDSPTAPSRRASVTIIYRAATAIDPAVQAQFSNCVNGVRPTHVHPGWRGFAREVLPVCPPDRFEITFTDVPVGSRQSLRISDPNACAIDPNGATTLHVFANSVLLTDVVGTPGNGTEPGLAFTAAADGTVTP